jgi:hypothetical protein
MTRQQLLRLVRESRAHLRTATPEQKVRLLKIIRESYREIKSQDKKSKTITETQVQTQSQTLNTDYLDEK